MSLSQRPARQSAAVLFVAFSLAVAASVPTTVSAARTNPPVVDVSKIRIDNFGRVNATYYRGAQPQGRDYVDLAALGVKTLINLTSDDAEADEQSMTENAGMTYFQLPMTTHEPPTPAKLAEFLKIATDPARQPVYVHCVGGRHRTGVMTAAYRMTHDAWTADQAFQEMKQYKYGADFLHPEFKAFVYNYRADSASPTLPPAVIATVKTGT